MTTPKPTIIEGDLYVTGRVVTSDVAFQTPVQMPLAHPPLWAPEDIVRDAESVREWAEYTFRVAIDRGTPVTQRHAKFFENSQIREELERVLRYLTGKSIDPAKRAPVLTSLNDV